MLTVKGGPTRSEWEDEFPAFCRQYGLPEPIVIELDSWEFHKDRIAFETDRDKDFARQLAGYATARLTWKRMKYGPVKVAAELHELVRQRT